MYAIKEIYYTLQGEGYHTGRPAIFCRFSGCNLWTGREADRPKAICQFCDTDFWGTDGTLGGKYTADQIVEICDGLWPSDTNHKFIVCTGGEPALQLDSQFVSSLQNAGYTVAVETNGTLPLPPEIDWICMSPKAGTDIILTSGDELKLVYPQQGIDPEDVSELDYDHFYLQPMDSPTLESNSQKAIEYCKSHPKWKLSLQIHKILNIP